MKYPAVRNYLGGSFVGSERPFLEVHNPSDGSVISRVPLSSQDDVDAAVASAQKAFPSWSATPIKERVQVFYRYKALLENNIANPDRIDRAGAAGGHHCARRRSSERH